MTAVEGSLRQVHVFPTGGAAYGVTFSHDGSHLAVVGGSWYGLGYANVFEVATRESRWSSAGGGDVAFSGCAFDRAGAHLAVSAWLFSHRWSPVYLFRQGESLPGWSFREGRETLDQLNMGARGYATGILIHDGRLIVRRTTGDPALTLSAFSLPDCVRGGCTPWLTSSRVARLHDGRFVTGLGQNQGELVACTPRDPLSFHASVVTMPHVTAVAVDREGSLLVGHDDGCLSRWYASLDASEPRPSHQEALTAACFLADGKAAVTACRSGFVRVWEGRNCVASIRLDGSVRSLAAHPAQPLIAVGTKLDRSGGPSGAVVLLELSSGALHSTADPP